MQEVVYIYLDDIRVPTEPHRKLVKNYDEFVNTIQSLPKNVSLYVSFDHDLADEHYTPEEYRDDYEKSKKYQESKKYKEKT
jgi:hypothetical protein